MAKAKAVILKTNSGIKLLGRMQCSNGAWWDAEGCFKYCNDDKLGDFYKDLQASKLKSVSTDIGNEANGDKLWYTHRENFVDVEIDYETNQEYVSKV